MFDDYENYGAPSGYGMPLVTNPINPRRPIEKPHFQTMSDMTFTPNSEISSKIPEIILVNSFNRNTDIDDANGSQKYKIQLRGNIREVVEIKMEIADIPKSRYLIHSYNDTFRFQETNAQVSAGTYLTATIPHGDYDEADLCTEIQEAIDSGTGVGSGTYTVSYNTTTHKITITQTGGSVDVFNIIFTDGPKPVGLKKYPYFTGSIGKVLGFKPVNHTGTASSSYTGDWAVDLSYGDYIVVHVSDQDILDTPIDSNLAHAFCVVYYDAVQDRYRILNDGTFDAYRTQLKDLIRTGELNIELFDQYGNPYETNGADHSFVFSIRSMASSNYDKER